MLVGEKIEENKMYSCKWETEGKRPEDQQEEKAPQVFISLQN